MVTGHETDEKLSDVLARPQTGMLHAVSWSHLGTSPQPDGRLRLTEGPIALSRYVLALEIEEIHPVLKEARIDLMREMTVLRANALKDSKLHPIDPQQIATSWDITVITMHKFASKNGIISDEFLTIVLPLLLRELILRTEPILTHLTIRKAPIRRSVELWGRFWTKVGLVKPRRNQHYQSSSMHWLAGLTLSRFPIDTSSVYGFSTPYEQKNLLNGISNYIASADKLPAKERESERLINDLATRWELVADFYKVLVDKKNPALKPPPFSRDQAGKWIPDLKTYWYLVDDEWNYHRKNQEAVDDMVTRIYRTKKMPFTIEPPSRPLLSEKVRRLMQVSILQTFAEETLQTMKLEKKHPHLADAEPFKSYPRFVAARSMKSMMNRLNFYDIAWDQLRALKIWSHMLSEPSPSQSFPMSLKPFGGMYTFLDHELRDSHNSRQEHTVVNWIHFLHHYSNTINVLADRPSLHQFAETNIQLWLTARESIIYTTRALQDLRKLLREAVNASPHYLAEQGVRLGVEVLGEIENSGGKAKAQVLREIEQFQRKALGQTSKADSSTVLDGLTGSKSTSVLDNNPALHTVPRVPRFSEPPLVQTSSGPISGSRMIEKDLAMMERMRMPMEIRLIPGPTPHYSSVEMVPPGRTVIRQTKPGPSDRGSESPEFVTVGQHVTFNEPSIPALVGTDAGPSAVSAPEARFRENKNQMLGSNKRPRISGSDPDEISIRHPSPVNEDANGRHDYLELLTSPLTHDHLDVQSPNPTFLSPNTIQKGKQIVTETPELLLHPSPSRSSTAFVTPLISTPNTPPERRSLEALTPEDFGLQYFWSDHNDETENDHLSSLHSAGLNRYIDPLDYRSSSHSNSHSGST